jgi:hypothetical protein
MEALMLDHQSRVEALAFLRTQSLQTASISGNILREDNTSLVFHSHSSLFTTIQPFQLPKALEGTRRLTNVGQREGHNARGKILVCHVIN